MSKTELTTDQQQTVLTTLQQRFEKHPERHSQLQWKDVEAKLLMNPAKLWSLSQMEETGGEPDVVGLDEQNDAFLFMDCSPESPKGRRSLCYDQAALESRKEYKPKNSAVKVAEEMGVKIMTEDQYRHLQSVGEFDKVTSSWLLTPSEIRKRGGAVFGDRRYDHVFLYHNGAESYYASRGFRGCLMV